MILDITIGAFLILITAKGIKKGGILQLGKLFAFLAALFCLFYGKYILNQIENIPYLPPAILNILLSILVYVIILLIWRGIKQKLFSHPSNSIIDQLLGGSIALLRGILIITVIIFLTATIPDWIPLKKGMMNYSFNRSYIFPYLHRYNPLAVISIYKLFLLRSSHPELLTGIKNSHIKKLLKNSKLNKAVKQKDIVFFFNHQQVQTITRNQDDIREIILLNIQAAMQNMHQE